MSPLEKIPDAVAIPLRTVPGIGSIYAINMANLNDFLQAVATLATIAFVLAQLYFAWEKHKRARDRTDIAKKIHEERDLNKQVEDLKKEKQQLLDDVEEEQDE
ncbi:MAG: hypothetical protein Q7J45_00645 [bacterium]|nr:hypothetical protein [bacterium]